MLTFYYHPLSPIARRVWWALLEKQIPFDPVVVDLSKGKQLEPEFLALNPFHHVPVLMDGEFRLIESLAILDYLETLYPSPSLLPQFPQAQAKMRMVQMVTANELMPKLPLVLSRLSSDVVEGTIVTREAISDISPGLDRGLQFLNEQLSEIRSERTLETNLEQQTYFVENRLTLADIVVGSTIPLLCRLGISLLPYPALHQWRGTIGARQPWQQTEPSEEDFQRWRRWLQVTIKRRQRNPAS